MGRRHEQHEEHADESWLIPYADILTLLLALFIVLFASSTVDEAKLSAMYDAFYQAFNGHLPNGGVSNGTSGENPNGFDIEDLFPPDEDDEGENGEDEDEGAYGRRQLQDLYYKLQSHIELYGLSHSLQVEFYGDSVLVTLTSDVWFAPGKADVTPAMQEQAGNLNSILREVQDTEHPLDIIVAGHTDDVPQVGKEFDDNWDLGAMRAHYFLKALFKDGGLDQTRFSTRSYGEFKPIDTNDTREGRQHNRRVELLVSVPLEESKSGTMNLGGDEDSGEAEAGGEDTSGAAENENE